jgi:hypothetical protein
MGKRDGGNSPPRRTSPRTTQVTFAMPSLRVHRATDDFAREVAARIKRAGMMLLGFTIIALGILIAPIPGPGGIPVIVVGVMIVLRNSFKARRQFVKLHRAYPKTLYPIRRLLRRDPEVVPLFYHQTLRVERLLLPNRIRFVKGLRRRFRGR